MGRVVDGRDTGVGTGDGRIDGCGVGSGVVARTEESIRGIISVAMHARLSIQSSKDSFGNDGGSELWRVTTPE